MDNFFRLIQSSKFLFNYYENNYWRVPYQGLKYFTVKGQVDELQDDYVVNGVPLVETVFDSDYWVWINNLSFTIPVYSVLSWFTDKEFNNPLRILRKKEK